MPNPKPRAFACRRFTPAVEAALRERFELGLNDDDSILAPATIVQCAGGAEVLFVTATESLRADTLARLPELRIVATLSVGLDHIDLAAARAAGIHVLHTPDVLSDACAEIAMMLLLNACRRGFEADRLVRSGQWRGWAPTQLLGVGLVGRRLGIFGMGRIGRAIAARARGFGVTLGYHNRSRLPAELEGDAVHAPTLDALMQSSDLLVIAAPGSAELRGAIDARRLALMPRGAVLVNISRGDLIDDAALVAALESGHLHGAGLDVFAGEPAIHPGYRRLDNVFLSPHIGSATHETRDAMGWLLIDGIEALARGETPDNLVT
ncbi:D-glycerate dehydrogenase [soil metagenome]